MPLFRPRLNLTARLMLAMMLVVVIVTSGMLWMMRQRVETSYLRLFEERFRSQIEMFNSLQTVRLERIRERCRMLAKSAAVVEALQLGSGELPDSMLADLQTRALVVRDSATAFDDRASTRTRADEKATDPASSTASTSETTAAGKTRSTELRRRRVRMAVPDFIDLALVSSQGRVHSLKSGTESGAESGKALNWLQDNRISKVPEEQQTGYLMADSPSRFKIPREVILTPVEDPSSQEVLGALAVGLPLSGYGENTLYDLSRPGKPGTISTGLWLEDQLFTGNIPVADQEALKVRLRAAMADPANAGAGAGTVISERLELSGTPHQMMLRRLNSDAALPPAWGVMLSSLSGMKAEQTTLANEVLAAAAAALAAGLMMSYFLSRSLLRPVRALVRGTREIRQGKYATRVPVLRRDELGVLGESFNEMAGGLEERERYHNILVQVTDYEVARRLIRSPSLGGERREVSVLFCDIRGFTAVTDGMAPEDVISMLNEHMTALTACVHECHGVVDKFVGDLIMAVFGAPESGGDDAGNAARCALEMVRLRSELNLVTQHPKLEIGIGVASGPAVAGCMGSENRLNYTVLGERVNLASRLCSAAPAGGVLLDAETVERLRGRAGGTWGDEMLLKGFSRAVRPFRLSRLEPPATPDPAAEPERGA